MTPTGPAEVIRSARRRVAWPALVFLVVAPSGLAGQSPIEVQRSSSPVWDAVLAGSLPGWPPDGAQSAATHALPWTASRVRAAVGPAASRLLGDDAVLTGQVVPETISPTRALLYSGVLPGWGQRRLDRGRWWGFLAVEVVGWGLLFDRQRTGHDFRTRYRDLAWFVARRGTLGERMDGDFEYYEALGKYRASGAFDADPYMGGVQPETDTTTFNGAIWSLANEIFLVSGEQGPFGPGSPEYEHAMEYYASRSIGPEFHWDWNGDDVSRAEYDRLIQRSDAALRQVTTVVGVILANHLAAAFDAFITARLRTVDSTAEFRLVVVPEAHGRWWVGGQLLP
ncbi:MAG: hypothetical protein OXR82_03825 [Gammaproteobacteria bacterium]|nr:hypothetical protein [Gammaproteobacteria bacterium]MDE0257507.1 hypothetical protein [Gammaproteobacteria bacterium]